MKQKSQDRQMFWDRLIPRLENVENVPLIPGGGGGGMMGTAVINAPINVKPEGGTPGICGAFDFSEDFLVKVPTVEPQNWVK